MVAITPQPLWNPADKAASVRAYAEWLHAQAADLFLADRTHGHFLFLFNDGGLASMNPVPPNTEPENLLAGVRQSVQKHSLYAVITIAEAWTYMPRLPRDHTALQILNGEMNVSDLNEAHKAEALMVRMETRDGEQVTWIDPIVRDGSNVTLGPGMVLPSEKCLKMASYFGFEG